MVDELVPWATTWEGSGLLAVGVESMLAPSACVCVCVGRHLRPDPIDSLRMKGTRLCYEGNSWTRGVAA
jgi:hypothetical protein